MSRSRFAEIVASTALVVALVACDDPPPPSPTADSSKQDAGPQSPAVGGKMGEVAKSLEQRTKGNPAELAKQPPITGIFPEGVADMAHAPNTPPRLEIIQEGSDPKVSFSPPTGGVTTFALQMQTTATGKRTYLVEISPPEQAGKALAALKEEVDGGAKEPEKKDKPKPAASGSAAPDASASASAEPPPGNNLPAGADRPMVATIYSVGGGGRTADPLATINFTITKTGAAGITRKATKESTDPQEAKLRQFELTTLEGFIFGMYPGLPGKPVGQGAAWTVTDRLSFFGSDVVRYRLFEVVEVTNDAVRLGIAIRQYAANDQNLLIKEGTILRHYEFIAQGDIQIGLSSFMPDVAQIAQLQMQANIVPTGTKPDAQIEGENIGIEGKVVINRVDLTKSPGPAPGPAPGEPEKKGEPKKPPPKPRPAPAPAPPP